MEVLHIQAEDQHIYILGRQVWKKAIDEYVTQALEWEKESHSAMVIYRQLQQLGYTGGYYVAKRIVRDEKRNGMLQLCKRFLFPDERLLFFYGNLN